MFPLIVAGLAAGAAVLYKAVKDSEDSDMAKRTEHVRLLLTELLTIIIFDTGRRQRLLEHVRSATLFRCSCAILDIEEICEFGFNEDTPIAVWAEKITSEMERGLDEELIITALTKTLKMEM